MSSQKKINYSSQPPGKSVAPTAPTSMSLHDNAVSAFTSFEKSNLIVHLDLIGRRLTELESGLKSQTANRTTKDKTWLEVVRILFGGWPAFGLIFMVLFYSPIKDAINAIPEKVRSAEEIGMMGVSLKNTIRVEAQRIGAIQLSETLPSLSPAAIEFLLRGSHDDNYLSSHNLDGRDPNLITAINVPSQKAITVLRELEAKKLIVVRLGSSMENRTVSDLAKEIKDLKRQYPLKEEADPKNTDVVIYRLRSPSDIDAPRMVWNLTDLGKNAVEIILKAVSAQLKPQPSRK